MRVLVLWADEGSPNLGVRALGAEVIVPTGHFRKFRPLLTDIGWGSARGVFHRVRQWRPAS